MITDKELLAPERLVSMGREMLYEAVNTRRLVAFVGSGVSLVYGQPTWFEFIDQLREKLNDAIKSAATPDADGLSVLSAAEAARMRAMAEVTRIDESDGLVTLELIRRAYVQIERNAKHLPIASQYGTDLQSLFTFNAVADGLLTERLGNVNIERGRLKKGDREASLDEIYSTQVLAALANIGNNKKLKLLINRLRQERSRHHNLPRDATARDRALPIDRRSLLAVFLAKCSALPDGPLAVIKKAIDEIDDTAPQSKAPNRPLLNPLREMDEWLRLRRYLSTNYDLGLEDQHMIPNDSPPLLPDKIKQPGIEISNEDHSIIYQRRDGRVVRSDVNDGVHVAPLFDFALGGVDNTVHIYHLHGRVDRPETLIAADGEYNRLYRSERSARNAFDHAYEALIVGNPILFVGSGMSEAELTRVLRANVSNPDVLRAAPAIVLREAIKPQRKLVLAQTELATKLGVRVVYTGHARRGAVYTLRDHLLLIDYVAYLYQLNVIKGDSGRALFKFTTEKPDFSELSINSYGLTDEEKLNSLCDLIKMRFRLLWDLDFERHIVPWLILTAPKSRRGIKKSPAGILIADYLNMLVQKLISAALRHELRQIGHESVEYFRERSTAIIARKSIAAHDSAFITRHISESMTLALPGSSATSATPAVYVAHLVADRDGSVHPNQEEIECLSALLPQGAHCQRTIVLGARGIGKGRLLAKLVKKERPARASGTARRELYINCCYGQEIDSILTIIDQFLRSSSSDHSDDAFSRREHILSSGQTPSISPPLIVLGGVDRLFGTDGTPLSVEFEWLLDQLLDPERQITLLVTGELRCLEFFRGRIERNRRADATPGSRSTMSKTGSAVIWELEPNRSAAPQPSEQISENRFGLYAKLFEIAKAAHRPHYIERDRHSQVKMVHGARQADFLIGDALETLEMGKARFPTCNADDTLALEIVKACAFIGLPFEVDVLVSVPAIKRRLKLDPTKAAEDIRNALARTLQLGLVNVVEPFGCIDTDQSGQFNQLDTWEAIVEETNKVIGSGRRLVVHRLIAKVLKDRFGVPNSANVLSDSYNLSLYAVQPDDASVPEPRVTGELEELIDHLMNAWKETELSIKGADGQNIDLRECFRKARRSLTDLAGQPYSHDLSLHYLEGLRNMRRRLSFASPLPIMGLRAAGGVIRGYYSAVNLFGLDLGDQSRAKGMVGAISDHKQRIRQLLNLAIEAQKAVDGNQSQSFDELKRSLECVSGMVTELQDETDCQIQDLKRDTQINLLCSDAHIPELWWRQRPKPIEDFFQTLDGSDEKTLCVSGLRARLQLCEPKSQLEEPIRPFFDGEIVWLLNERAMLAMAQGDLYTASTTFEFAFDANRAIERDRYHPNRARLTINRAYLWIERGRIADARRELESLRDHLDGGDCAIGSNTNEGRLIAALCAGYLGLCNHLSGMIAEAEALYESALAVFSAMRQQRAIAIFEQHRSALLRHIPGRDIDADAALKRGIAAATGGRHTDILYRLRIAKAQDEFSDGRSNPAEVIATLSRAVHYGSSLEMHRVAVEALTARAQVYIKLGDVEASSRDVSRAAAKAAQYGMTLRRIWLRVMTGQVYKLRDDAANARIILERAVSEGSHIGYQRAVEVATRQLINLKTR